jgi:predicted metalloprotease with PDZ domain
VARAVTVLAALDGEIRERTDDLLSLDDVVVDLVRRQDKLTNATFQAAAERAAGGSLEDFFEREAPK